MDILKETMKHFENAKIELITFLEQDVITTSGVFGTAGIYDEDALFTPMGTGSNDLLN